MDFEKCQTKFKRQAPRHIFKISRKNVFWEMMNKSCIRLRCQIQSKRNSNSSFRTYQQNQDCGRFPKTSFRLCLTPKSDTWFIHRFSKTIFTQYILALEHPNRGAFTKIFKRIEGGGGPRSSKLWIKQGFFFIMYIREKSEPPPLDGTTALCTLCLLRSPLLWAPLYMAMCEQKIYSNGGKK